MQHQIISYKDGDLALAGRLVRPAGTPRAAVLLVPTIMGPTPESYRRAQMLADEGYAVFVADYYGRPSDSFADFAEVSAAADALRADPEAYRRRFLLALEVFRAQPKIAALPAAAIGYCMGGQVVLELARAGADLGAVASFHGLLDTARPAEAGQVRARILVCHGNRDPLVPREQVRAFMEEMDAAEADWHLHVYSQAVHSFTNPEAGGRPGIAYDASADRQSWAALLAFFAETFSPVARR